MTDGQKRRLEQQLWKIADNLRGMMGGDEFRDYILGLIFYKYLSESMHERANAMLRDGLEDGQEALDYADLNASEHAVFIEACCESAIEEIGFALRPNELFSALNSRGKAREFIIGDLAAVLAAIDRSTRGSASEDDFSNLFEDLNLQSSKLGKTEDEKNKVIVMILRELSEIDFCLDDAESDVLGDAYEFMIGQFASGAGKKAGEFYTPQEVSSVLARIVSHGKESLRSVYDPTCGSGSLLLRVAKQVKKVDDFFGQEMNPTTFNLARMNMILHKVHYSQFHIANGNTLTDPQHLDQKFEAIVANPPFSANWDHGPNTLQDERFAGYGKLAPKSKADFAFIQHMLWQLADDGTMAVVVPHGVLFRGAAEGEIRKHLIKDKNWLDAVIGLPENIFYGTTIPTAILVFRKNRTTENVLFVDASMCFEKAKNQNYLCPADIDAIVNAYTSRIEVERFAHLASRAEIEENDWNLNIPRYVDSTEDEEERVDLATVTRDLKAIDANMVGIDQRLRAFCAELGLECPV